MECFYLAFHHDSCRRNMYTMVAVILMHAVTEFIYSIHTPILSWSVDAGPQPLMVQRCPDLKHPLHCLLSNQTSLKPCCQNPAKVDSCQCMELDTNKLYSSTNFCVFLKSCHSSPSPSVLPIPQSSLHLHISHISSILISLFYKIIMVHCIV